MGYTQRAISGFGWQTALKASGSLVTLAKIFVLARLLTPDDFGIFSLTAIALGVTESLTETGINLTLIQAKQSVEYYLDTAWVIAIVRGLLISILMIGMGFGMSRFFNQPDLVFLVCLAALVPLIKGFINPAIVTFHKNLNFFADSSYRLSLIVAEALFSVAIVWINRSVVSLVIALILAGLFEVLISFLLFKSKPTLKYHPSRAATIFGNAKWLGLSSFFSYVNENADNLIIGKLVGTYGLGLYQNSYSLAHKANYDLAKSIHHSTLPIYSKVKDDAHRLRRAFNRTALTTLLITSVTSLPLLLFPDLMVRVVLGPQWIEAGDLVRWLVFAGLLQGMSMVGYTVLLSKNALKMMNLHQGVSFGVLLILVTALGSRYGLNGAVMAMAASRLLAFPILLSGLWRALKTKT